MFNIRQLLRQKKLATIPEKVKNKDGSLTNSVEERNDRITDHFCDLLNQPSTLAGDINERLPKQALILWWLQDPFTFEEGKSAVKDMKDRKALGIDRMAIEILKYLVNSFVFVVFLELANFCLQSGSVFAEWKDTIISPFFKKGDVTDMNNYRGISLISHFGKLLEKLITIRLTAAAENFGWLPESQNGFRVSRSTTHSIFVSRLIVVNNTL